jgi:hypothetical protein
MDSEKRQDPRFDDIARVDIPDLCIFPGILVDISQLGCKVRFSTELDPDMESDYELKITPAGKNSSEGFVLIVHPMWKNVTSGSSEIGFRILRSPGTRQLIQHVKNLQVNKELYDADQNIMDGIWR